jgi:hypothetical protein
MGNTTSATKCETDGCDREQEIGIRVLGGTTYRMCTADATRVYDAYDPSRRGGKVELTDLS